MCENVIKDFGPNLIIIILYFSIWFTSGSKLDHASHWSEYIIQLEEPLCLYKYENELVGLHENYHFTSLNKGTVYNNNKTHVFSCGVNEY